MLQKSGSNIHLEKKPGFYYFSCLLFTTVWMCQNVNHEVDQSSYFFPSAYLLSEIIIGIKLPGFRVLSCPNDVNGFFASWKSKLKFISVLQRYNKWRINHQVLILWISAPFSTFARNTKSFKFAIWTLNDCKYCLRLHSERFHKNSWWFWIWLAIGHFSALGLLWIRSMD